MAPPSSYGPSEGGHGRSDASGFSRYYEVIREHWLLIVVCTIIAVIAAAVYVSVAPKSYTATSELLANPAQADDTDLFSLPVLHTSGDPTQDILTAAALVTTPQVADSVIAKLGLHTSAGALLSNVQSIPIGQSNLVGVSAEASTASQARAIANAFANQVIVVRTAGLHAAIMAQLPSLQNSVNQLPPADRNGPGSLGEELTTLKQLLAANDPTLSVVAAAELPTSPSSPKTKLSLVAGLFGGLLLGIGAAFAFSALDPRIRREDQVRELLDGVPVLARIPQVGRRKTPGPLIPNDLSLPALEAYRTLRTSLATRASGKPQAYLLTGCAPSEGKTTSAISLAVALAQGGGRVILIEADLRRPRIASSLGLKPEIGTEQVLSGESTLRDALMPIWFDSTPMHVLPARGAGAGLADRLSFAVAQHLIAAAKEQADFVVIDSPPLTAVIDALPLAQLADEILLVVRAGHSRLTKLAQLAEILNNQGAYPTGVVMVGGSTAQLGAYSYGDYLMPERSSGGGGGDSNSTRAGDRRESRRGRDRIRQT
jgi:succinoglycan biosynthesis transport protein ExoP